MYKKKPIYIMNSKDVTECERQAVMDGVRTILEIIGLEKKIQIKDLGYWNHGLGAHESVDWYLAEARMETNNGYGSQVNDDEVLKLYANSPLRKETPHYIVIITDKDLGSNGYRFVIGNAMRCIGVVFSAIRFRDITQKHECIKTEVMHELGHVFRAACGRVGIDALSDQSGNASSLYNHCDQECVMRQGRRVPEAWIRISEDRLKSGKPFCDKCIVQMKKFFS